MGSVGLIYLTSVTGYWQHRHLCLELLAMMVGCSSRQKGSQSRQRESSTDDNPKKNGRHSDYDLTKSCCQRLTNLFRQVVIIGLSLVTSRQLSHQIRHKSSKVVSSRPESSLCHKNVVTCVSCCRTKQTTYEYRTIQ